MSLIFGLVKTGFGIVKFLLGRKHKKEEEIEIAVAKETKKSFVRFFGKMLLVIFAFIGVVSVVSAIAFGVYKFISAKKLKALEEEFDEIEFDEDFDEAFEEE